MVRNTRLAACATEEFVCKVLVYALQIFWKASHVVEAYGEQPVSIVALTDSKLSESFDKTSTDICADCAKYFD